MALSKFDAARIEAKKKGLPYRTGKAGGEGQIVSPKKTSVYKFPRKNQLGETLWYKTPQTTRSGIEGVPNNVGTKLSRPQDGKRYQISTKAENYLFKTEKQAIDFYNQNVKKGSGAQVTSFSEYPKDFQEFFKNPKIYKRYYKGPMNVSNIEDIWKNLTSSSKTSAESLFNTSQKNIKETAKLTKQGYMRITDLADDLGRADSLELMQSFKNSKKFNQLFPNFIKENIIKDTSDKLWVKTPPSTLKKLHAWAADPSPSGLREKTIKNIQKAFKDEGLMKAWKAWKPGTEVPEKLIHNVLGKKGSAYTMMQLGRVLQGKEPVEGVPKNVALGNKIIDAVRYKAREFGDWHTAAYKYAKADMDAFLPPGKKGTTFGDYQRLLTKALNEVGLEGFHIDEINALRSGVRGGTQPYSVFSQVLEGKYNKGAKRRFDSENAKNQMKLQKGLAMGENETIRIRPKGASNALTMTKDDYLKYIMKLQNDQVDSFFEKVPKLKGKIDLVKFDLRDPKTVYGARWKTFDKGVQEAILKNFGDIGFTLDVGKKATTQKELFNVLNKLIAQGETGGPVCNLAIVKAARGGRVAGGSGIDCSGQIKQVLQENPDQLIQDAASAKVKPGESTGFRNIARQILNKIPKGGRLGAILAGAGAVGAGTWAMMGDATAEEAPTTDDMTYNATTGTFDNVDGDPETQEGILNWIADHPIYSGLAPIPIGIGAGLGAEAMGAEKVGKFFKSMKFILPPAYAAEKLHQYKRGDDMGQMFANPIDAVWAMALDTKSSARDKWNYYKNIAQKTAGYSGVTKAQIEAQQLGLHPRTWKNIGKATMAPRSFGTRLVFPFAGPKPGAGLGMKVFRGALRMAPFGPLPMALLAGSMAWDKYKFNKEVGDHVDALRARGVVSEEDAQSMNTIYKQGWLGTTAIGAKILGSEELMLDGELADIEKQKEVLAKMKEFYGREQKKGKEFRAGERQEDFFDWFSGGGRVGLAEGGNKSPFGMTRRSFLKWLIGSIATGVAAVSGKGLKQIAKTATTEVAKEIPKQFTGVPGMPEWFFRAVQKIKASGKLIEMADKHYVGGDIYEMVLPIKVRKFDRVAGKEVPSGWGTEMKKVILEENPLDGTIGLSWKSLDERGIEVPRFINYRPGSAGYQKFGVDDPEAAAQGISEYRRVKVEEPEFEYGQPDYSSQGPEDTGPDSAEYLDIFTEGDSVVEALERLAGKKIINKETEAAEKQIQKKLYKDLEGEEAIIPDPEGVGISDKGDVYGEEQFKEIIEGEVPEHLKKKASGGRVGMKLGGSWADWMSNHSDDMTFEEYLQMDIEKPIHPVNKNTGGVVETGNIARRPGAVPPLSGPNPQGTGIVGLFSNPKRVNVV